MASPSPVPLGLVVKNGSNSRSRTSGGMPGPSSETTSSTSASTGSALQPDRPASGTHVQRIEDQVQKDLPENVLVRGGRRSPGGTSTTSATWRASASPDRDPPPS